MEEDAALNLRRPSETPTEMPLSETKARLSEVLRLVENGARVTITNHGRPVADLVPHDPMARPAAPPARALPKRIPLKPGPGSEVLVAELRGKR